MQNDPTQANEVTTFAGSVKAGWYTAQLFVELRISPQVATVRTSGKEFTISRENCSAIVETSILGLFKRGIRFQHHQSGVPPLLIFYPRVGREALLGYLRRTGWDRNSTMN